MTYLATMLGISTFSIVYVDMIDSSIFLTAPFCFYLIVAMIVSEIW